MFAGVAPDDGAELQTGGVGAEIGNRETGFECPHLAGDVLAHQKLHAVTPGCESEAGVVLEALAGNLSRLIGIQFDLDEVPDIAGDRLLLVLDLAQKIELRESHVSLRGQLDGRARNLDGHRHEITRRADAEIVDLHRERDVGNRFARGDGFSQLLFPIRAAHLAPDFTRPISLAMFQLGVELARQLDGNLAELAVHGAVSAVVAEDVIAPQLLLGLRDSGSDVVAVEESFSARIGGQRDQRLLRVVDAVALRVVGRTGERARPARSAFARAAAGRVGHQAAGVDGVEGHVGFGCGRDRSFQLRLVVDAGLTEAAGEVNERLLFRESRQHPRGLLKPLQFAVGVKDVELGLVRYEGGAGVLVVVTGVVGEIRHFRHFADGKSFDDAGELIAIAGEVGQNGHPAGIEQHRHDIVLGDLGREIVHGGFLRAQLLGDSHGREIEIEDHQPLVVILNLPRNFGGNGGFGRFRQFHLVAERDERRRFGHVGQLLELKDRDLLWFAVFGNRKVARFEIFDRLPGLGFHRDVDDHQVAGTGELGDCAGRLLYRLLNGLSWRGS